MFGLFGQFIAYYSLQYLMPVLALRIESLNPDKNYNSLFFAIPSTIFLIHMPLVTLYTQRISRRGVLVLGFALVSLGMMLVGNSVLLRIPETLSYTTLGLVLVGLGFSSILVPIFPEMLEAVEEKHPQYLNSNELNDVASGIFNASMGIGEAISPIISSLLNERLGF